MDLLIECNLWGARLVEIVLLEIVRWVQTAYLFLTIFKRSRIYFVFISYDLLSGSGMLKVTMNSALINAYCMLMYSIFWHCMLIIWNKSRVNKCLEFCKLSNFIKTNNEDNRRSKQFRNNRISSFYANHATKEYYDLKHFFSMTCMLRLCLRSQQIRASVCL